LGNINRKTLGERGERTAKPINLIMVERGARTVVKVGP